MHEEGLYLRALELFERRHELTDDELAELAASPVMQDAMLDLMDMTEAVADEKPVVAEKKRPKVIPMVLRWAVAACVAAVVVLFVWNRYQPSPAVEEEAVAAVEQLPEGTVFMEQDNSKGVTLACVSGANVTPTLQSVGNSVVADFTALKTAEAQEVRMDVPVGYDATITLPDGSVAYLHPGSRLKFPTQFVGDTRQVILEGECYFKVTHDAQHPFIVSAGDIQTTVLGTEFNVSTRGKDNPATDYRGVGSSQEGNAHYTTVTLISGSVRVNDKNSDAQMTITPGQQVRLQSSRFVAKMVDTNVFEAWRDGFICYDNMPMSEVMEAIGRNYNMTVQFANREAMKMPIRFTCERKASIDEAISLINSLKKAHVVKRNGIIVVE